MIEVPLEPVRFFDNLSRFAGVSEGATEREPAGEVLSEVEGSAFRHSRGLKKGAQDTANVAACCPTKLHLIGNK